MTKSKIRLNKTRYEVIEDSRLRMTIIITAIAWLFFAVIFGTIITIQAIIIEEQQNRLLQNALAYNFYNTIDDEPKQTSQANKQGQMFGTPDVQRCIILTVDADENIISSSMQLVIYDIEYQNAISYGAIAVKNGKFKVGDTYFKVANNTCEDGNTMYAIKDITQDRKQIFNITLICSIGHCVTVIIIGLLAFFLTKVALNPISTAFRKQKELTANASHELKTPLAVISTNLAVIKSEPQSTIEDNQKWLDSIDTQIARINGLVMSMLELSKMDSVKLLHVPVDISDITESQCLDFEVVCFEKGIRFDYEITPKITILGDKPSLQRLVLLLLDNAAKYCGSENKQIKLTLSIEKRVAHLSITNSGEIISKEQAKRVFDRFYRVDEAHEQNSENNSFGLGLAIAQSTVIEHNGHISCSGIENFGTVFDVYLPIPKRKQLEQGAKNKEDIQALQNERNKKRECYFSNEDKTDE